jgi:fatty-acyl-CoA synthase
VAVVGLPDDKYGEILGAFIRAAPGARPDREELFAYLRQHLSPQKTSKDWFLMEDFLLTASGKIQKFVLRQQWADGQFTKMS